VSNSVVTSGLAVMACVALLIGLALLIRWVSPLAAGLPGLVLLAWTGLYVASPVRAVHYIPLKAHSVGLGFAGLGTTGILGAAGVVLVMPLFFPSRWRRPAGPDVGREDDPIEADRGDLSLRYRADHRHGQQHLAVPHLREPQARRPPWLVNPRARRAPAVLTAAAGGRARRHPGAGGTVR
jgi:hypothetical protein